jgi:hypothetical protein
MLHTMVYIIIMRVAYARNALAGRFHFLNFRNTVVHKKQNTGNVYPPFSGTLTRPTRQILFLNFRNTANVHPMFWKVHPRKKENVHPMFARPARKGEIRNRQRVDISSLMLQNLEIFFESLMSDTINSCPLCRLQYFITVLFVCCPQNYHVFSPYHSAFLYVFRKYFLSRRDPKCVENVYRAHSNSLSILTIKYVASHSPASEFAGSRSHYQSPATWATWSIQNRS